ncbi:hypothetical protein RRG08_022344 [Elysia crispata]|uniref:Uncharacterized protein n=1 Tax=Elysia crispata TaxID=231223 RepID=A0AAE1D873_9GAST|nr:hypothetical protein RRG08_022344 [Elysia crispata]
MEADEVPAGPFDDNASVFIKDPERLAVKTMCTADILKNVVQSAERLSKVDKVLSRYLHQARLLLAWKQGSGAMKMAGSAAKTVGTLMLVAAPLHPRIAMGMRVAHKLWKLGTGLKILNAIANMIRDVWQKGCRDVLMEFTHCAATLTRNLGVFGELVRDLQNTTPALQDKGQTNPAMVIRAIHDFVPPHQIPYLTHVINIAFGNESYSPLFAFTALTVNSGNSSNIAQIMLEIESFHFDDFIENSESRALVAIGSFLHVSRELCDFLDGFQRLTDRDCQFLQECLHRLGAESVSIMKAVAVLVNLDKIRKQLRTDTTPFFTSSSGNSSLYDNRDVGQTTSLAAVDVSGSNISSSVSNNISQAVERETCQERNSTKCLFSPSPMITQNVSLPNSPAEEQHSIQTIKTDASENCSFLQIDRQSQLDEMTYIPVPEFSLSSEPIAVMNKFHHDDNQDASEVVCQKNDQPIKQTPEEIQPWSLMNSFFTPFSSIVGRGSSYFIHKSNSLLPIAFRRTQTKKNQGINVEHNDQFSEPNGSSNDLTMV